MAVGACVVARADVPLCRGEGNGHGPWSPRRRRRCTVPEQDAAPWLRDALALRIKLNLGPRPIGLPGLPSRSLFFSSWGDGGLAVANDRD